MNLKLICSVLSIMFERLKTYNQCSDNLQSQIEYEACDLSGSLLNCLCMLYFGSSVLMFVFDWR